MPNEEEEEEQLDRPDSHRGGTPKQIQEPPPKTTVTFSLDTMGEFTHEELQQVIRKYDGEYKRLKKVTLGKAVSIK